MALFLFKPHVTGPEGNITSPDVVIDRLFVNGDVRPLGFLTSELAHQVADVETPRPAYAITAMGGGALISPALCLSSAVVVARKAWRLNNLDGHVENVTLNGTTLAELGLPSYCIAAAGGSGDTLPRGFMLICESDAKDNRAELIDPNLGRRLDQRLSLSDMNEDSWGPDRPSPRYSIGPTQKDIPHFI